jgi:FMN phosphatase YigB (HAD superfamily)
VPRVVQEHSESVSKAHKPRIEAGIFDVGGVLISNEMAHVWRDVLTTLQLEEDAWRPAWGELGSLLGNGQIEEADFWKQIVQRTGARGALPDESLFVREYGRRWTVHHPVLDLVTQLKQAGLRTAVLSNTIAGTSITTAKRGFTRPLTCRSSPTR